jgi:hypothetical protein
MAGFVLGAPLPIFPQFLDGCSPSSLIVVVVTSVIAEAAAEDEQRSIAFFVCGEEEWKIKYWVVE